MRAGVWAIRAAAVALIALVALAIGASASSAATAPASTAQLVQAAVEAPSGPPPLQDSHGVEVSSMRLQLGVSSNPLDWQSRLLALGTDLAWSIYTSAAKASITLLDTAVSLDWVDALLAPVKGVYVLVGLVIADLDLWQLMVFVVGVVGAVLIVHSRRVGRGLLEVFVGCLVAALGTGMLANPWQTVLGEDGFLGEGRDAGAQLATAIANGGEVPSPWSGKVIDVRQTLRTAMVDSLIRTPHQILNYGVPLDGTACEQTYNEAVGHDDARSRVVACNAELDDSSQATAGRLAEAVILLFSATSVVVANMGLAVLVFGMVLLAAGMAIAMLWNLVFGIVRGEGRTRLAITLARALAASAGVGLTVAFAVFWARFIDNVRTMPVPMDFQGRMALVSMLLLAGPIVLWVCLKRMRKVAELRAAQVAAAVGGPSQAPESRMLPVAAATAAAAARWGMRAMRGSSRQPDSGPTPPDPTSPLSVFNMYILRTSPHAPGSPSGAPAGARPGPGTGPRGHASSPRGGAGNKTAANPARVHLSNVRVADGHGAPGQRLRHRLAASGVQLALGSVAAAATSGASVPVQMGARLLADAGSRAVVRAARRDPDPRAAQLRQRLQASSSTAAPRTFISRPGSRPDIEILTPVRPRSES